MRAKLSRNKVQTDFSKITRPLFLSLSKVFTILPFQFLGTNNSWARRLVRIRAPACGAGRQGFKSPRARHAPKQIYPAKQQPIYFLFFIRCKAEIVSQKCALDQICSSSFEDCLLCSFLLREEEDSNGAQHCLLLLEYSVASILLHDSYRLEEEKIDNFFNDFCSFNLTLDLREEQQHCIFNCCCSSIK